MKREYTKLEIEKLRSLLIEKTDSDKSKQKGIRQKMRALGFKISDFSTKKGFDINDFEKLIDTNIISIQNQTEKITQDFLLSKTPKDSAKITFNKFFEYENLPVSLLSKKGFYCIKLKTQSSLPERYMKYITSEAYDTLYIGKAEKQSLKKRLEQEILHTSPGTFFRSIGVVLEFWPPSGSLKEKANKRNYQFNEQDTYKIVSWLKTNIKISIIEFEGDFHSTEKKLIEEYSPLLNNTHNPKKLKELEEDRKKARQIACS